MSKEKQCAKVINENNNQNLENNGRSLFYSDQNLLNTSKSDSDAISILHNIVLAASLRNKNSSRLSNDNLIEAFYQEQDQHFMLPNSAKTANLLGLETSNFFDN